MSDKENCLCCKHLDRNNRKKEYDFFRFRCKKCGHIHIGIHKSETEKEIDNKLSSACCGYFEPKENEQLSLF